MSTAVALPVSLKFIELVLKYKDWGEIGLNDEEMQIIREIVAKAGFEFKEITWGRLEGDYLDQDGRPNGDTYSINQLCPLKVIKENGEDYFHATGWLDCAFRLVKNERDKEEKVLKIVHELEEEIARRVPLLPIQLNENNFLREDAPRPFGNAIYEYFVNHRRDDDEFDPDVVAHQFCDGFMDRRKVNNTHDAIVCRQCHLRVEIPNSVRTYGDLRTALNSEPEKKEERQKKYGEDVQALIKIKKDGSAEVLEDEALEEFFDHEKSMLTAQMMNNIRYSLKTAHEITWKPITKRKICKLMK